MKKFAFVLLLLTGGCANMQPLDLGIELEALGGLIKVAPQITVGDGQIGPRSIDVEIDKEALRGDE